MIYYCTKVFDVKEKNVLFYCFAINDDKNTYTSPNFTVKKNRINIKREKNFLGNFFLGIFLCQTNRAIPSNSLSGVVNATELRNV